MIPTRKDGMASSVLEGPEVVFSRNIIGIFTRKCVSTYIKQTEYYLNADLFVSISNEES